MKLTAAILALAAAGTLAACDKPNQNTAYNNSGSSAATAPTTTVPARSDTAGTTSANSTVAPGPAGDANGAVSETLTTGKIKAAIAADSGLKDTDISVTTNAGTVMLGGTVKSQDQIALATSVAQKMDGVQKVESNLTVK